MIKISNLIKHPLFAGSAVMVVGSNFFNFAQFVYHFIAGRMLGKVYYGDFASLISIFGIVGIIQISLGLTIIKFISSAKKESEVVNLTRWTNWWSIWAGLFLALIVLVFSQTIAGFLNLRQPEAVYILAAILTLFVVLNTQRSILQGLLRFDRYVLSLLVEAAFKIFLIIGFVLLGMAVFGAMLAFLVGVLFSLLLTRFSLTSYLAGRRGKRPELLPIFKYSLPVFIQGIALTSMYSADLILVKHFFSPEEAGTYASLAVLGRVALFGSTPVIHTMFPLVARRFSHSEPYHNIFYLSILLVGGISALIIFFYILFPEIPVGVLYGKEYLVGAHILWWFGIFMMLLAIAMLFTQFYLSIGKTSIVWLFAAAAILQIGLIWFIHPNLLAVIQLSIISAALLVGALLVYFPYHNHRK